MLHVARSVIALIVDFVVVSAGLGAAAWLTVVPAMDHEAEELAFAAILIILLVPAAAWWKATPERRRKWSVGRRLTRLPPFGQTAYLPEGAHADYRPSQTVRTRATLARMEVRSEFVADADHRVEPSSKTAQRHEARAIVGAYHQEQLRRLLEHVRAGFDQLDAGGIDEFELDDLIHRYKRAAKHLWVFCESSGGQFLPTAAALQSIRDRGEERDWWAESERRRD